MIESMIKEMETLREEIRKEKELLSGLIKATEDCLFKSEVALLESRNARLKRENSELRGGVR